MERRPPSIIGPLILITIGVLFLLANAGMLRFSFWEIALRFWPLILILVGLEILIGRHSLVGSLVVVILWVAVVAGVVWLVYTQGGGLLPSAAGVSDQIIQPLGDIKSATVDLNIGSARVQVRALNPDSGDLMKGTFRHAEGTRVIKTFNVAGSEGRLSLKEEGINFILGGSSISNWDIGLYPALPIAMRVNGGIGRATLDLGELNITSLTMDSGIGAVDVTMPRTGIVSMRLNGGIGSATILVPPEVSARIRVSSGLGGIRVDEKRFPKFGDVYQNADYASAANRLDIDVDGGLGSIQIR